MMSMRFPKKTSIMLLVFYYNYNFIVIIIYNFNQTDLDDLFSIIG